MKNIEKIIEYIDAQTEADCRDISQSAAEECERIRSEFSITEQNEYWKAIDAGTRETEHRLEKLSELAIVEANKQVDALRKEMLDEAFALAARKLSDLPVRDYDELLTRLGIEAGCSPDALVARYKSVMTPAVLAALFD